MADETPTNPIQRLREKALAWVKTIVEALRCAHPHADRAADLLDRENGLAGARTGGADTVHRAGGAVPA